MFSAELLQVCLPVFLEIDVHEELRVASVAYRPVHVRVQVFLPVPETGGTQYINKVTFVTSGNKTRRDKKNRL